MTTQYVAQQKNDSTGLIIGLIVAGVIGVLIYINYDVLSSMIKVSIGSDNTNTNKANNTEEPVAFRYGDQVVYVSRGGSVSVPASQVPADVLANIPFSSDPYSYYSNQPTTQSGSIVGSGSIDLATGAMGLPNNSYTTEVPLVRSGGKPIQVPILPPILVTPVPKQVSLKDGDTLTLQCGVDETIASISNGRYGSTISSCSRNVTIPAAIGKNSYVVDHWFPAQVNPEGDPCPNEPKSLQFEYVCRS